MSILLSVNPPFAGWLVDGEKTIEWRKKMLPSGTAYVYETKKGGGCGQVIGEVEVIISFECSPSRKISHSLIDGGRINRRQIYQYAGGNTIYANYCLNAKRYAKPIPLSEFERPCPYHNECFFCKYLDIGGIYEPASCNYTDVEITRPPQSWCYCEDLEGESE